MLGQWKSQQKNVHFLEVHLLMLFELTLHEMYF